MPSESEEVTETSNSDLPLAQVEQAIAEQAPDLLKQLPKDKREILAKVVTEVAIAYQGPLPPPIIAEGWERIVPGAAKQFFDEFVAMGQHQRAEETKLVNHSILTGRIGQIFAFVLGLVGLGGGIGLCAFGNNVGGLGIAGTSLIALVGAFLKGLSQDRPEKVEEKPAPEKKLPPPKNKPKHNKRHNR